jgi:hypothetical protein
MSDRQLCSQDSVPQEYNVSDEYVLPLPSIVVRYVALSFRALYVERGSCPFFLVKLAAMWPFLPVKLILQSVLLAAACCACYALPRYASLFTFAPTPD